MSANGVANGDEPDWLHSLSPSNAACIRRLLALPSAPSFAHVPTRKQAAVAAILYESSSSELRVIMSTRALHLRSHPGQASLPGGKVDSSDRSVVETALRESVEEIALPARSAVHVHTGYPFLSKMGLLVHPVVFFLKNGEQILPKLRASPSEVADIWTTPLVAFLSSSHQLIKGLTADVLISVAQKTFGEKARYKVEAEGQWSWERMVQLVVKRYTGERRPEQRWGDGESGDKQGSSEAFETFVGVDEEEEKEQDVSV
uniref:Nudix hydrolase domain-containing protein n=1 Tax=Kalmanozyma brasiliensis (strain GHG001) TaxID=1365824 RepID=V5ENP4_KALBG